MVGLARHAGNQRGGQLDQRSRQHELQHGVYVTWSPRSLRYSFHCSEYKVRKRTPHAAWKELTKRTNLCVFDTAVAFNFGPLSRYFRIPINQSEAAHEKRDRWTHEANNGLPGTALDYGAVRTGPYKNFKIKVSPVSPVHSCQTLTLLEPQKQLDDFKLTDNLHHFFVYLDLKSKMGPKATGETSGMTTDTAHPKTPAVE